MFNFPLYEVRSFTQSYWEGMYFIIETPKSRWVFDHKYKTNKNYWGRRLELLNDPFRPYKMYPLNKKITQVSQIVNSKTRLFVDDSGRIQKYKPQNFYKVKYERVSARWSNYNNTTSYKTKNCPTTFVSTIPDATVLGYVIKNRHFFLYELCNEMKKDTRKKL